MKEQEILELNEIVSEPKIEKLDSAKLAKKEDIKIVDIDPLNQVCSQNVTNEDIIEKKPLISESVANNSTKIIKNLLAQKKPTISKDSNLEDLVVESMRPFLSQWLEKNLESIVEKVVREQIKTLLPNE